MQHVECIINNELKKPSKSYYKWLLDLCVDITKYQHVNKMNEKNMAIVLAPNLYDASNIRNIKEAICFVEISIQWRKQQRTQKQYDGDTNDDMPNVKQFNN